MSNQQSSFGPSQMLREDDLDDLIKEGQEGAMKKMADELCAITTTPTPGLPTFTCFELEPLKTGFLHAVDKINKMQDVPSHYENSMTATGEQVRWAEVKREYLQGETKEEMLLGLEQAVGTVCQLIAKGFAVQ